MSHPARPTVIAENQTASPVVLTDLGATVPASGSLTLSDFFYIYEIQGSKDLYDAITAGDILINDGSTTLTLAQSQFFVTQAASAQNLQLAVTGPASSTANAIPKFSGTSGKALLSTPITIDGSNNIDMAGAKVINLGTPTLATDAVTKGYADALITGFDPKPSVRAATTANITLSGPQTIDGVSVVAGNRVLVKDQSTGSENGIYIAAAGAWARATDMAAGSSAAGAYTFTEEGTVNADIGWLCSNDVGSDVVGTDALTFIRFSTFQLATLAPQNVDKSAALVGTSPRAAREDHKHDISTAAPSVGIGGGNTEGTAPTLARSDHSHALRETSGPTDLTIAGIADGEIIRRTGSTIAGGVGKVYPASATDPSSPAPADGDRYYNTALKMWMTYDASRSDFLSDETVTIDFGRNGNVASGDYYRGVDGKVTSATSGFHAFFAGMVVALSYTRSDTDSATFSVNANGSSIATLNSTAVSGRSTTLSGSFNAGDILAVRNQAGGNTTSDVQGAVKVKWRV